MILTLTLRPVFRFQNPYFLSQNFIKLHFYSYIAFLLCMHVYIAPKHQHVSKIDPCDLDLDPYGNILVAKYVFFSYRSHTSKQWKWPPGSRSRSHVSSKLFVRIGMAFKYIHDEYEPSPWRSTENIMGNLWII